jgi:AmmeMemoRadiSam system protein B
VSRELSLTATAVDLECPQLRSDLRVRPRLVDGRVTKVVLQDPVLRGVFHPGFALSPVLADLITRMDGRMPLEELRDRFAAHCGHSVGRAPFQAMMTRLDELCLLDNQRSNASIAALTTRLVATAVRPIGDVFGHFYPPDRATLESHISSMLAAAEPVFRDRGGRPLAFIVPHGEINAAGPCTATAVAGLRGRELPDTYIIIGPNHVRSGAPHAATIAQPFLTPLGQVEVAEDLVLDLEASHPDLVRRDQISHHRDHSIETVLPFLQMIHGAERPFRILPLLLTADHWRPGHIEPEPSRQVWRQLAAILRESKLSQDSRLALVISGDFLHWGPDFGFQPCLGSDQALRSWDAPFFAAIEKGDAEVALTAWSGSNACAGRPVYLGLGVWPDRPWRMLNHRVGWSEGNAVALASFRAEA